MAKFSKAQYLVLTEAIGHALSDIQLRESPLLENAVIGTAQKIADYLIYDNKMFNRKQFIDGIKATAELSKLSKQGINL